MVRNGLHNVQGREQLRVETFHAKVILVDNCAYYAGSSNFMGSALDRSLECGVIVHGRSAHELYGVVEALIAVASRIDAAVVICIDFAGRLVARNAGAVFQ
jgi:phosphatidylserine/phosphatidylglycerophosphate/cardiolipin synthase-like enzyme